jgi:hypothetical protein
VYASLRAAGASDAAARTLTEIAGAESGWDDAALGDVKLEDNTWGPSAGLFQIRTLKGATGTGSDRDISALAGDDTAQAAAALKISKDGTDYDPWTTYRNGAYLREKAQVDTALATITGAGPAPSTGGTAVTPAGLSLPGIGSLTTGIEGIVVKGIVAVLGLALIGLGVARVTAPAREKATEVGKTAAKVAVLA